MKIILKIINGLIISTNTSLNLIACNKNGNIYDLKALQSNNLTRINRK